ncbi:MAG TPA: aminotransferase class V-fold PLP-dependent enzyme, partial [Chroococcales cyanobacterium]
GPNGTGFVYVAPELVARLEPVWLGDKHFERKEADIESLSRFESMGTSDVVRWHGLTAAIQLYEELGPDLIAQRQNELIRYLRRRLDHELPVHYRTPIGENSDYMTALLTFKFPRESVTVPDLTTALWENFSIGVRDDFAGEHPGAGIRVSCHYSVKESDLDALVDALKTLVKQN